MSTVPTDNTTRMHWIMGVLAVLVTVVLPAWLAAMLLAALIN